MSRIKKIKIDILLLLDEIMDSTGAMTVYLIA